MKQRDRISRVNDNISLIRIEAEKITSLTVGLAEHYNIVVLGFLNRMLSQVSTVQSISFRKDALLIARSVMEGYTILNWISHNVAEREIRAQRYREIFILNLLVRYDQIIEAAKDELKKKNYKEIRAKLVKQIEAQCKNVIDAQELAEILAGKPLPFKEFLHRLTGNQIKSRALFKLAEKQTGAISDEAYRRGYSPLAQFHHWEPINLDIHWDEKSGLTSYPEESEDSYFRALDICYICLSETVKLAAKAFRKEEIVISLSAIDRSHMLLWSPEQLPDR